MLKTGLLLAVLFADPTGEVTTPDTRTVQVGVHDREWSGRETADSPARRRVAAPTAKPKVAIYDAQLRVDPATGGPCVLVVRVWVDADDPAASPEAIITERIIGDDLQRLYPMCPSSAASPPPVPSPSVQAIRSWQDHVTLPAPEPRIEPGWAMTGRRAFLEDSAPSTVKATYVAFGVEVTVTARSTLGVDWGDGWRQSDVAGTPGPWPNGTVTHTYSHKGPVTVRVSRSWVADWRIGSSRGTIRSGLATTTDLPLDVREVYAVRNR